MIITLIKWVNHLIHELQKHSKIALGFFPRNYKDCVIAPSSTFAWPQNLTLGRWIYIGHKCFLEAKGGLSIEDGVIISGRVTVLSSSHNYNYQESVPYGGTDILRPVRIKKAAWICYGALILPGVTIGEGAIVGAGAVVTKNVHPGNIVGGNPAEVIGTRKNENWRSLIENNKYRLLNRRDLF